MTGGIGTWSRPVTCAARSYLTRATERDENCYILLDGIVLCERLLDKGRRQIVGLHVPGDVCNLSALSDGPADHDLVALSPVSYLSVTHHWLSSTARECPEVLKAVWREMSRQMALSAAWTVNIGQRTAYQRLAHFFCELDTRLGAAGRGGTGFKWQGTQGDVGAATGLSLVHVNRTLRSLEDAGLISYGRRVKIHDRAALRSIAGFDPQYLALAGEDLGNMPLSRIDNFDADWRKQTFCLFGESAVGPAVAEPG